MLHNISTALQLTGWKRHLHLDMLQSSIQICCKKNWSRIGTLCNATYIGCQFETGLIKIQGKTTT
jgi:hypothetical protein